MRKNAALLVLLILIVSGVTMAKPAYAAIPKPSVPEFTVRFVASSYSVTTTDPYTGLDVTQQYANNTIQVTIKNQPLSDSTHHFYYNVRTRPHFEGNWTELYPVLDRPNAPYNWDSKTWTYSKYLFNPNTPNQSNTDFTVVTIALGENGNYLFTQLPSNAQVDFQVEAIVGHDSQAWAIQHPFTPEYGGYYESAVAYDTDSGWSSTQTITIGSASTATPTASPSSLTSTSPNPTATPAQPDTQTDSLFGLGWEKTALIVMGAVVAALVAAVVVLWRKLAAK